MYFHAYKTHCSINGILLASRTPTDGGSEIHWIMLQAHVNYILY